MTHIYTVLSTHDVAKTLSRDASNGFTYAGAYALAEYLEDVAQSTGDAIELDVVALRCGYKEYKDLSEFQEDHGVEYDSLEAIDVRTPVIRINDGESFIIEAF